MFMLRGAMDRRIELVREISQIDEAGKPLSGIRTTLAQVWAKYTPVSDRERMSHSLETNITARFVIRWSNVSCTITPADFLVFEGDTYGIWGIKEIDRRRFLEITAKTQKRRM